MANFSDILGINARHLLFIKKYNKDNAVIFADNKLKTKRYLEARGIPVPKLIATIRNFNELDNFYLPTLTSQIVIKPNSSSGGDGIIVLGEKTSLGWRKSSGDEITLQQVKRHIHDILSGAYSKSGQGDICLIEKRIITHEKLATISYKGLPDVRIIVFNMVPVMAMLRLPTITSDGKANMHQGGIGAGIDLAKGEITYLSQYNKIIDEIPGIGEVRGYKIPFWDKILQMAVKTQMMTDVGYLGVDIALDKNGPLLLEMNARAGLSIQLANMAPLRKRLNMVEKLKVKTIEKGIRIAKDLFGRQIDREIEQVSGKTVIGTKEFVTLHFKEGPRELLAKINPSTQENYIDTQLFKEIAVKKPKLLVGEESIRLKYKLTDEKTSSIFKPFDLSEKKYQMILGRRELKNLLIDPYKYKLNEVPDKSTTHILLPNKVEEQELDRTMKYWKEVDSHLLEINKKIHKNFSLFPINYKSELERFQEVCGAYNPLFIYKNNEEAYHILKKELLDMHIERETVQGKVFYAKQQELLLKLDLYFQTGKDASYFTELSEKFFTPFNQSYYEESEELEKRKIQLFGVQRSNEDTIGAQELALKIKQILKKYKLHKWNVIFKENLLARVSVSKSNKRIILVSPTAVVPKNQVDLLIAHEIETHVLRLENSLHQPYKILRNGLAHYLLTEEGLAIYNQHLQNVSGTLKEFSPAINYLNTRRTVLQSFADCAKEYVERLPHAATQEDLERLFKKILRTKQGIGDTSITGGFTKDYIYFTGYKRIEDYIAAGGELHNLYYGKISVDAVEDILFMKELVAPKILPSFYT